MKILYHCGHPELHYQAPTGYGRHMRGIVKAFRDAGHEVILDVAGGTEKERAEEAREKGGEGKAKRLLKKLLPVFLWESLKDISLLRHNGKCYSDLLELVEREAPDLIYERVSYLHAAGLKVGKEKGIPVFLEINAPLPEEREYFAGKSLILGKAKEMEKDLLEKAEAVFPVTASLKAHLLKKYALENEEKFQVVSNAIDPDEFERVPEDSRSRFRSKFSIEEEDTLIGFVGSIFPYHGVDRLLYIYQELVKSYSDLVLMIVGDGEQLPDLKAIASQDNTGRVIFTGGLPQEMVLQHIAAMDIAVIPGCKWFNSPVKLFEYGAMQKPVIGVAEDGVASIIDDGVDGWIHKGTQKDLFDKVGFAVNQKNKREELGKKLQEKVFRNHTWSHNTEKILSHFYS